MHMPFSGFRCYGRIETSEAVRDLMELLLDKSADTRVSLDGVRVGCPS